MKKLTNEIRAYALKNALEFGKAESGKILPKLFQHGLEKKDIQKVMPEIQKIVKEINSFNKKEIEKQFGKLKSLVKEREEKEKALPEIKLTNTNEVVTRLAPEPSKYLHLGHAISFLLNYLYAKKYRGKCLLRFEDTNPEKVSQEYVDAILEDIENYLEIKINGIRYISDDIKILYDYAEKLIDMKKAYMCFCDREKMQKLRHEGKECQCRANRKEYNAQEWKHFIEGKKYTEGEAVLRIKGDMKSKNHVMRDAVLFRFMETPHYRHKKRYKVWPLYDFYNPIEDSLMNVSLIFRSNEFDLRVELQDYIKELLNLKKQQIIHYGRFNVADFTTKGREIRELIASKELLGWDDPRLITLIALKRRGITKEAIYTLTEQIGLSQNQVNLEFDMIASINRKIIDAKTNRYSFVHSPVKLKIKNAPKIEEIEMPIHPDKKEKVKIKIKEIYISKNDNDNFQNTEIRLLHMYNIIPDGRGDAVFTSTENKNIPRINWVSNPVKVKVLMPDGKFIQGFAESTIKTLKKNEIVQFERFGFARLDKKGKDDYEFWFAHK